MSYQVDLDVFSGPMDLLLYLIAREEVNIQEVSISQIVDQYLEFMQQLKDLDVEIGSDFLVMACTLILIKSKALLPMEEIDLEEEIDGQDELIQHLLEYKKIKMLSRALQAQADHHTLRVPRPAQHGMPVDEPLSDEDLNLWDIIQAFSKIVKETGLDQNFSVVHSEKPISEYINSILDKLIEKSCLNFEELFAAERTRSEAISNFISLLELSRRRIIKVRFNEDTHDLEVTLHRDADELLSVKEDGIYDLSELFHDTDEPENPGRDHPEHEETEPQAFEAEEFEGEAEFEDEAFLEEEILEEESLLSEELLEPERREPAHAGDLPDQEEESSVSDLTAEEGAV
ncbi:MAG: segregation/condensation protein A [Planctomycetota bacterium]